MGERGRNNTPQGNYIYMSYKNNKKLRKDMLQLSSRRNGGVKLETIHKLTRPKCYLIK
jgi:hypothetical protein